MWTRNKYEELAAPVVAGLVVLLTLIGIIGTAIREPRPHDIAVAVSGAAPVVQQFTQRFAKNAPGAFAFTSLDSEAAARAAVDQRDAVAALVIGPAGPRLIVAGAAGDAITGGVTAAFAAAFKAQGATLTVETVHPFQAGDAHGIVLFFLVFATLVSSLLAGALAGMRGRSWQGTLGITAVFAVAAGTLGPLAVAWLVDGYGDRLWQVMAITTLVAFAIASVTAGLARLAAAPGIGLAALVLVLLGTISAGGPLGSELLPDAYRAMAPWLPAGPAYSALRGALYFDGAGVWGPLTLLSVYGLLGIALVALRRERRSVAGLSSAPLA